MKCGIFLEVIVGIFYFIPTIRTRMLRYHSLVFCLRFILVPRRRRIYDLYFSKKNRFFFLLFAMNLNNPVACRYDSLVSNATVNTNLGRNFYYFHTRPSNFIVILILFRHGGGRGWLQLEYLRQYIFCEIIFWKSWLSPPSSFAITKSVWYK